MRFHIKKFLYLLNDISGILLKKESINKEAQIKKLQKLLIAFMVLFVFSFIINILLIIFL